MSKLTSEYSLAEHVVHLVGSKYRVAKAIGCADGDDDDVDDGGALMAMMVMLMTIDRFG